MAGKKAAKKTTPTDEEIIKTLEQENEHIKTVVEKAYRAGACNGDVHLALDMLLELLEELGIEVDEEPLDPAEFDDEDALIRNSKEYYDYDDED